MFLVGIASLLSTTHLQAQTEPWQWVDPRIGSVGVGRTFPGPCVPFGMVKPGPDCGVLPNAGWAPMPEPVSGFSQTHVSGTGGGQKYGNILIQPLLRRSQHCCDAPPTPRLRTDETVALAYYSTTFDNGIRTEITTSARCAHYRFHYPAPAAADHSPFTAHLFVDATHYLGKDSVPDQRERQQFVGAEVEVVSQQELRGYSRVRGGWNNGDAYTVYFALRTDRPFTASIDDRGQQAMLCFNDTLVEAKVGISYVSALQASKNIDSTGFDQRLADAREAWNRLLSKIIIEGTDSQKRMFYTALYHTMLMPVDKTGENPKWTEAPYYDDYYAIWDTYRTSSPLITLLDPDREAAIINSLLNIYAREGYMPDARSGDCNGRTQGGSNAEVMIADAMAKGIDGIDYSRALEAMLKDAETDPGSDHEKHGRGGLTEYRRLGYVPYGIDRAGTRTIEYAYNDWCIADVARRLGRTDVADEYGQKAQNWRRLWRKDYEFDGMRGFIMPRDADGQWLDSVTWGHSKVFHPTIEYTPVTKVAPWYLPWWSTFFYEATSQEYSLFVPHDVPGLIEACGGTDAFRARLDRFFERGYYNVQNEPSFLTPCLYHFIGRPDLSTQRIHQIITDNYTDRPDGLPGNDDSGAMSSWLAFHMMGLYPNAGQSYYLLNVPMVSDYTMTLSNGRRLHVTKRGKGNVLRRCELNGRQISDARIEHSELMQGGELVFVVENKTILAAKPKPKQRYVPFDVTTQRRIHYTLNRQYRTWPLLIEWHGDTLRMVCKQTTYNIPRSTVEHSSSFCWLTPQQDGTIYNNVEGTFAFISHDGIDRLLRTGSFVYDGITWRSTAIDNINQNFSVSAVTDGTTMRIVFDPQTGLYLVTAMEHNPLGIDWKITDYETK